MSPRARPVRPLRRLLLAPALLFALPACAQKPAPARADTTHPALWVARDADTTIYLFGTIHVLKPGLRWFDEAVRRAFDRSGEVMLELVQPDPEAMRAIVAAHAAAAPGAPALPATLTPAQRVAYLRALAGVGLPATSFDRSKPWYAAVNLSLLPLVKAGFDPANGPETVITAAAKAANKPVAGLETADQQIGYFDSLTPRAQHQFLVSTLADLPKLRRETDAMVADWARGDPDALARLLNDDLTASPEIAQTLLYRRNQRWAAFLADRMKRPGTVFVAVGAGHLAGRNSVLDDLRARGVTVTRVRY